MTDAIRRALRHLKPTPLEQRTTNELPRGLLRLFGCSTETPKNKSLDAWEVFTRQRAERRDDDT